MELRGLYSPDIGVVISTVRWTGNVARMGPVNAYRVLLGTPAEGDHAEDMGVHR